jgi:hypothetical protein
MIDAFCGRMSNRRQNTPDGHMGNGPAKVTEGAPRVGNNPVRIAAAAFADRVPASDLQ